MPLPFLPAPFKGNKGARGEQHSGFPRLHSVVFIHIHSLCLSLSTSDFSAGSQLRGHACLASALLLSYTPTQHPHYPMSSIYGEGFGTLSSPRRYLGLPVPATQQLLCLFIFSEDMEGGASESLWGAGILLFSWCLTLFLGGGDQEFLPSSETLGTQLRPELTSLATATSPPPSPLPPSPPSSPPQPPFPPPPLLAV